jgi:hypothetical protein
LVGLVDPRRIKFADISKNFKRSFHRNETGFSY